jgi:membrane protease YdiL (CAAX protease family)
MSRRRALLALVLLVPAPSLGALCGMVLFPDSLLGAALFAVSKVWLVVLPAVWTRRVEGRPFRWSPARRGGFGVGALTGLVISAVILAAYLGLADVLIDRPHLVERLTVVGLSVPARYIGAAAYWILVNAVLEEYVWRWFCVQQCERLFAPRVAIVCSALFFTIHHVVAMSVYMGWAPVVLCSAGIFVGGAIWSAMYVRYRSIWPAYLSHAIVDLCVFSIGAWMLFGGGRP